MSKIDWTKPVQTRSGLKARVLATDIARAIYPVVAAIEDSYGGELIATFTKGGAFKEGVESEFDLSNTPITFVRWLNIYNRPQITRYFSREEADRMATDRRIACIRIEYEEGEGL